MHEDVVNSLPKPYSATDQYLYALVCAAAKVKYSTPFKMPFTREEQYLRALVEVVDFNAKEIVTPGDLTITTAKIVNGAVTTSKIADKSITEAKLANAVTDKLLGADRITASMIKDTSIPSSKLTKAVSDLLLGDSNVKVGNLADLCVTASKLSTDVSNRLLSDGNVTLARLSSEVLARLNAGNTDGATYLASFMQKGTFTYAGVTAVINDNGTITLNGTSTSETYWRLNNPNLAGTAATAIADTTTSILAAGKNVVFSLGYVSGTYTNGAAGGFNLSFRAKSDNSDKLTIKIADGSAAVYDTNTTSELSCLAVYYISGITFTNYTFKPDLRFY
jgi:hypothetical protein